MEVEQTVSATDNYRRAQVRRTEAHLVARPAASTEARLAQAARGARPVWAGAGTVVVVAAVVLAADGGDKYDEGNYDIQTTSL